MQLRCKKHCIIFLRHLIYFMGCNTVMGCVCIVFIADVAVMFLHLVCALMCMCFIGGHCVDLATFGFTKRKSLRKLPLNSELIQ